MTSHLRLVPSIGFSGAGFMGCYHLGVADCLIEQGLLLPPDFTFSSNSSNHSHFIRVESGSTYYEINKKHTVIGCSAGALIATAVVVGVKTDDSMNIILEIARKTREKGGLLDSLRPGFSLVDQVEELMVKPLEDAVGGDSDLLQHRVNGRLRIGLTDVKSLRDTVLESHKTSINTASNNNNESSQYNSDKMLKAFRYIDKFRDVRDIVAACVTSSYIPGITGPILLNIDQTNQAVLNSQKIMNEIRHHVSNSDNQKIYKPSSPDSKKGDKVSFWDGGLVNMWPTIDDSTLIVSPLSAYFTPNPAICPLSVHHDKVQEVSHYVLWPWKFSISRLSLTNSVNIDVSKENVEMLMRMTISSNKSTLESMFQRGYDDARRYLRDRNLIQYYR